MCRQHASSAYLVHYGTPLFRCLPRLPPLAGGDDSSARLLRLLRETSLRLRTAMLVRRRLHVFGGMMKLWIGVRSSYCCRHCLAIRIENGIHLFSFGRTSFCTGNDAYIRSCLSKKLSTLVFCILFYRTMSSQNLDVSFDRISGPDYCNCLFYGLALP